MAIIALKLGGELLLAASRDEAQAIAGDVARLGARGERVVIVHGGGPQATELSKRLGIEPRVVAGRRITDEPTLEVMKMVVAGRVNVDLCALLAASGVRAVGLSGAIRAHKRPPRVVAGAGPDPIDFGHVGDVIGFDLELLESLGASGRVPVLACLGLDPESGAVFNINADVVATQLAAALPADKLLLVTATPGVLGDVKDPSTRIPRLSRDEAKRAIADGRVGGGMIPKLEEAFGALDAGVREIHILGKLAPGELVHAVDQPGDVGTVLTP